MSFSNTLHAVLEFLNTGLSACPLGKSSSTP
jgi:hypothetical protein